MDSIRLSVMEHMFNVILNGLAQLKSLGVK